jgi:hypothetical protein
MFMNNLAQKADHLNMETPMCTGDLAASDFRRADSAEKRQEPRHAANRMIELLPCANTGAWSVIEASLVDCSAHGLGFLVDRPMRADEEFLVKLRVGKLMLLLYTVQHCRVENGRYRVGAKFTGLVADKFNGDGKAILNALTAPESATPSGN